jgi:hypothetical protein
LNDSEVRPCAEAALDLVEIWRYIKKQSTVEMADRVDRSFVTGLFFWQARPAPDIGARI